MSSTVYLALGTIVSYSLWQFFIALKDPLRDVPGPAILFSMTHIIFPPKLESIALIGHKYVVKAGTTKAMDVTMHVPVMPFPEMCRYLLILVNKPSEKDIAR